MSVGAAEYSRLGKPWKRALEVGRAGGKATAEERPDSQGMGHVQPAGPRGAQIFG